MLPASAVTFEDLRPSSRPGGGDTTLYLPGLSLESIEREAIRLSLRRHGGKRAAVVKELQIAKSTVMKRIAQWGLQDEGREAGAGPDEDEEAEEMECPKGFAEVKPTDKKCPSCGANLRR